MSLPDWKSDLDLWKGGGGAGPRPMHVYSGASAFALKGGGATSRQVCLEFATVAGKWGDGLG